MDGVVSYFEKAGLSGAGRYVSVHGSRMHYVDRGKGPPVVFIHGNPTSSFLWRKVIEQMAESCRCIAPDLIGMGGSDAPDIGFFLEDHYRYLVGFLDALDLQRVTLVMHDAGGYFGSKLAQQQPGRVEALVYMEALLTPTIRLRNFPVGVREFFASARFPRVGREMIIERNRFVEEVLEQGMRSRLSAAERAAYRAPFREQRRREPVWRFPNQLPIEGQPVDVSATIASYMSFLQRCELPKLLLHVLPGVLGPPEVATWCGLHLPNTKTVNLGEGGHYIPEDFGPEVADELLRWRAELAHGALH